MLEANAPPAQTLAPQSAPLALTQVAGSRGGPQVLFPPDGASVMVDGYGKDSRGLALSARGENLRWYVDGQPLTEADGQVVWRPSYPGFYRVTVVDGLGRQTVTGVRVR